VGWSDAYVGTCGVPPKTDPESRLHDPDKRSHHKIGLRPPGPLHPAPAKAVEIKFKIIKKTLENEEDILISDFGKF